MDRLDELAIFVRIVEEGSLARAAARLRRSPPAVTRALAALEDRLGVRLVDRTTRRLAPTEAGRAFYDKARGLHGRLRGGDGRGARRAGARPAAHHRAGAVRPPPHRAGRRALPRRPCRCRGRAAAERPQHRSHRRGHRRRPAHRPACRFGAVGAPGRPRAAAVGGEPGLSQAPWHAAYAGRPGASRGGPGDACAATGNGASPACAPRRA